jgi:NADH dehydrogenase
VLVSFPGIDLDFPLQTAKREVEDRLRASRMTHTILQPTCFDEVWLSPGLGFDVAGATAQVYGGGQNRTSWISLHDVAQFAVAALDAPRAANATIKLGGPEALSPLDIVRLAERITGRPFTVSHVPDDALRAQYETATDPLQRTFAALMLYYARGDVIPMGETLRVLPVPPLRTVYEHLQSNLLQSGHAV